MFTANIYIKEYGEIAVVRAVNSQCLSKIFSLKHRKVLPEIKRQASLLEEDKQKQSLDIVKDPKVRKGSYGKKSKLNKLRGINGKKESEG
jgi:hypothetical protein